VAEKKIGSQFGGVGNHRSRAGSSARAAEIEAVAALRLDATEVFLALVAEFEGSCESVDDYDTLAQAYLGCGEVARALMATGGAGALSRGLQEAGYYFDKASDRVNEAYGLPDPGDDVRDRLRATTELVSLSKGAV
jgi:predicted Zn-dependent protease